MSVSFSSCVMRLYTAAGHYAKKGPVTRTHAAYDTFSNV